MAFAGYVTMLLGLLRSKAAGDSFLARLALGIFVAGLVSLLIAQIIQWFTSNPDFFIFPVGGVFQLLGGLGTGIAVIAARRWHGWQRFAPLLQGLYYAFVLFLPIALADRSPTLVTEGLWQVTWFTTSLALFTESRTTGPA